MAAITFYKCPCCDGSIAFDSTTQKMKCPYCDSEFELDALQSYADEQKNETPDAMDWQSSTSGWAEGEQDGLKHYACKACGGEIVGDDSMAASSCPFCGSPIVLMGQFSGDLKPDWVIPFKLDKAAAKAALEKHLAGKKLLPQVFRTRKHIDEIKGVYVPFWLFESDADAQFRFKGTRTRTWSDDDYDYTEISHYLISREGSLGFDKVPVDGSSKADSTLMESLEPFHFEDAVPFQPAYLAGYMADKYDVDAEQSVERANERIRSSTRAAFEATVSGYDTLEPEQDHIQLRGGKTAYALYPVWLLSTTWQGKNYLFAMNGQTGKFVGDLPLDKAAATKWKLKLTALCGAAIYGAAWLLWLAGIL